VSTYKEIVGQKITKVTSDPSDPKTGQMWYNTTTGEIKALQNLQAWSSGGTLLDGTAGSICGGFGTQTAGQIAGGLRPSYSTKSEQYNGVGWTIAPTLNTARSEIGGAGTQTAGIAFGGRTPPSNASNTSEEFDGSSFTEGNNLGTGMRNMGSLGTQTAALCVGGSEPANSAKNQIYDGTSWSEDSDLNTARQSIAGAGTSTAGIAIGGSPANASETWDGTSWTTIPNLNSNCGNRGGFGSSTAAIGFGGYFPPNPAKAITETEEWDGSTWSVSPATLATARYFAASSKNTSADSGLATGGSGAAPSYSELQSTEEYNSSTNIIVPAAWATDANRNNNVSSGFAMFGRSSPAGAVTTGGGAGPSYANDTEEYDGNVWTSVNDLGFSAYILGGFGTSTAGVACGGYGNPPPSNAYLATTNNYDGTNWTSSGNLPQGQWRPGTLGTQTAGLQFGGNSPALNAVSAEYDGSTWTTTGSLNNARFNAGRGGTQTAGLAFGGGDTQHFESYNGSTWTSLTNMPMKSNSRGGGGSQTAAIYFGAGTPTAGSNPSPYNKTLMYDGTSLSTNVNTILGRNFQGDSGDGGLNAFAGSDSPATATESFTPETITANTKKFSIE
jgi:hypothetical protein